MKKKKKKKITLHTHKENINTLSKLLNIMFYSPKQHTEQGFPQHFSLLEVITGFIQYQKEQIKSSN
jgi:hypothetical protein